MYIFTILLWITLFIKPVGTFRSIIFNNNNNLGLDGRNGIPGEPGLDGVPGKNGLDGLYYILMYINEMKI